MSSPLEGPYCPIPNKMTLLRGVNTRRYILTELGLEKLCPKCREYWPLDSEFYHCNLNGVMPGYCAGCEAEWKRDKKSRLSELHRQVNGA